MKLLLAVLALALAGCAGVEVKTTDPATGAVTTTIDLTQGKLPQDLHKDLTAAAARATANGYAGRAAVWLAEDAKLTAMEKQASDCINAIKADLPQPGTGLGQTAGVFDAEEALTEKIGTVKLVSAKTLILCKPMPVVAFPALLPKP